MIQNGKDLLLMYNGERLAACTANSVEPSNETRDSTTKDSGDYKEFEYGLSSFAMGVEGLVLYSSKNLSAFSENLSKSTWVKTGCTAAFASIAAPNGTLTGNTISGFSNTDSVVQTLTGSAYNTSAKTYTYSVWVKGTAGQTITIFIYDSGSESTQQIVLTAAWVRVSVTYTTAGNSSNISFGFKNNTDTATAFNVWGNQIEESSEYTPYKPSGQLFHILLDAINNGTKLDLAWSDQTEDHVELIGQVLVSNFTMTPPMHDNQTFTADLEGTGSLTQQTI